MAKIAGPKHTKLLPTFDPFKHNAIDLAGRRIFVEHKGGGIFHLLGPFSGKEGGKFDLVSHEEHSRIVSAAKKLIGKQYEHDPGITHTKFVSKMRVIKLPSKQKEL